MTIRTLIGLAGAAALTSAALAAPPDKQPKEAQKPGAKGSGKATALTDADITRAVERRLRRDPFVPFDSIDVKTDRGVVTLTGSASGLRAKDRAAAVAGATRGVRAVIDRIAIDDSGRTDAQVRADVETAIANDPAADAYEVEVAARGGVVTLTGTVQSWTERRLAEQLARGVRGAVEVRNEVTVNSSNKRTAAEMAADIRSNLARDRWVNDAKIDVRVEGTTATLTGAVGSVGERANAIIDAWITGITDVDADGLKVDPTAERSIFRRPPATAPKSDAEVAKAVRDALRFDPRVSAFDPSVSVRDGTVTLTGVVDNLAAKRAAEADARNTVGVHRVYDLLKVRPEKRPADGRIMRDVQVALSRDPAVNPLEVRVAVRDGVVYLHGTVGTYAEWAAAEDAVARVRGVVDVRNRLKLDHPDMSAAVPDITARDNDIRHAIEDQMWWSPFVDGNEVVVTVRDGVATLNGFVDTPEEVRAASENALEGGARMVINNLKVRPGPDAPRP